MTPDFRLLFLIPGTNDKKDLRQRTRLTILTLLMEQVLVELVGSLEESRQTRGRVPMWEDLPWIRLNKAAPLATFRMTASVHRDTIHAHRQKNAKNFYNREIAKGGRKLYQGVAKSGSKPGGKRKRTKRGRTL